MLAVAAEAPEKTEGGQAAASSEAPQSETKRLRRLASSKSSPAPVPTDPPAPAEAPSPSTAEQLPGTPGEAEGAVEPVEMEAEAGSDGPEQDKAGAEGGAGGDPMAGGSDTEKAGQELPPPPPLPAKEVAPVPKPLAPSRSMEGTLKRMVEVPPALEPRTQALLVEKFVRPFTQKQVQELLSRRGAVVHYWMDAIRTHCYVSYGSVEEAEATRQELYGVQWPAFGGNVLTARFVSVEEVLQKVEGGARRDQGGTAGAVPGGGPAQDAGKEGKEEEKPREPAEGEEKRGGGKGEGPRRQTQEAEGSNKGAGASEGEEEGRPGGGGGGNPNAPEDSQEEGGRGGSEAGKALGTARSGGGGEAGGGGRKGRQDGWARAPNGDAAAQGKAAGKDVGAAETRAGKGTPRQAKRGGREVLAAAREEDDIPSLDDLFRRTANKPQIYFLPLTDEQVAAKLKVAGTQRGGMAGGPGR